MKGLKEGWKEEIHKGWKDEKIEGWIDGLRQVRYIV